MADMFAQVPIFDRILSYLHVRDMCKFIGVNQRVYQMFLIPSYGSFLRQKKQEYLDELIAEKMDTFHIPRYGDMYHSVYIDIRLPQIYYKNDLIENHFSLPKVGEFLPSQRKSLQLETKNNAKNNRILQNQMHKRYRKG